MIKHLNRYMFFTFDFWCTRVHSKKKPCELASNLWAECIPSDFAGFAHPGLEEAAHLDIWWTNDGLMDVPL